MTTTEPDRSRTLPEPRLTIRVTAEDRRRALEQDVRAGLAEPPRSLPAKWLYDERGGRLYGTITELPEYYQSRTEATILDTVVDELAERTAVRTFVELGSGDSPKTRQLLRAFVDAGGLERFVPFDIDADSLRRATSHIAAAFPTVQVEGAVADMMVDLDLVPDADGVLVAMLGSTVGNFLPHQRTDFYERVAGRLRPGSWLLMGYDLVKDPARLVAAYDDEAGVTARFTGNVLTMLNRELGADFDTGAFEHEARWMEEEEYVRVGLRARTEQLVEVHDLDMSVRFAAGELLHLEVCCKFRRPLVEAELAGAGFALDAWWTDAAGDFAVCLARRC